MIILLLTFFSVRDTDVHGEAGNVVGVHAAQRRRDRRSALRDGAAAVGHCGRAVRPLPQRNQSVAGAAHRFRQTVSPLSRCWQFTLPRVSRKRMGNSFSFFFSVFR